MSSCSHVFPKSMSHQTNFTPNMASDPKDVTREKSEKRKHVLKEYRRYQVNYQLQVPRRSYAEKPSRATRL